MKAQLSTSSSRRDVTRYSLLEKPGFKVMKFNFYTHLTEGYGLIQRHLVEKSSDYTKAFLNLSWDEPDASDHSATTRYKRRLACYQCILHEAGFEAPTGFKVTFQGHATINGWMNGLDPSRGLTLEAATTWFTEVWNRQNDPFFTTYRTQHDGRDWADDDLKNLLRFLTRSRTPGGAQNESGYRQLIPLRAYHTPMHSKTFTDEIIKLLRRGKIVIVDLSQGDPVLQRTYSDRLCTQIFHDAMSQFIANQPLNYIQMSFEEAHNLFPRKDDPDLTAIYNRLAKEGAKLHLGLIYATQEVSSISANVLKNTQNWFVSHLNNHCRFAQIWR